MSKFQIFTEEQVISLRKGGKILHSCLQLVSSLIRPGVTTGELDRRAEEYIRDHGAEAGFKGYQGFPAALCTSVNEACVHGVPGERVLREGDIISVDCGVLFEGLYTDACVTVAVGKVSALARNLIEAAEECLRQAIGVIHAGVRIGDISVRVQRTAESRGFHPVRALTGHGLGSTLHQFPDIPNVGEPRTGPTLPPMTLLAIEPILSAGSDAIVEGEDGWTIYVQDRALTAHAEHTVLVREGGAEVLTSGQ
jgi:methionyl aminopeptidase